MAPPVTEEPAALLPVPAPVEVPPLAVLPVVAPPVMFAPEELAVPEALAVPAAVLPVEVEGVWVAVWAVAERPISAAAMVVRIV